MKQLILYGRGGQGVVTAAKIIAIAAAVYDGGYAQAVPAFTAERRGAPVYAYVRLSDSPIDLKSFVYEPDAILVFDHELPSLGVDLLKGVSRDTTAVLNWSKAPSQWEFRDRFSRVGAVDADALGGIPNIAMVAAFSRTTGWVSLEAVVKAVHEVFGEKGGRHNEDVARRAFEATVLA
ncbi:MAG TPA: pyruvate ferredoxin oxidoreductase [Firmicutes bacterium]|nr:pyruvate ferredoxin oxidoreductase [Candidatus Fermentithermobacillaceae bacterium]